MGFWLERVHKQTQEILGLRDEGDNINKNSLKLKCTYQQLGFQKHRNGSSQLQHPQLLKQPFLKYATLRIVKKTNCLNMPGIKHLKATQTPGSTGSRPKLLCPLRESPYFCLPNRRFPSMITATCLILVHHLPSGALEKKKYEFCIIHILADQQLEYDKKICLMQLQ